MTKFASFRVARHFGFEVGANNSMTAYLSAAQREIRAHAVALVGKTDKDGGGEYKFIGRTTFAKGEIVKLAGAVPNNRDVLEPLDEEGNVVAAERLAHVPTPVGVVAKAGSPKAGRIKDAADRQKAGTPAAKDAATGANPPPPPV